MLLAIEQGNTNTLFAIHDGKTWHAEWRTATASTRTADEYAVWLVQLLALQGLSLADLTGCIISTVVPQSLFNLHAISPAATSRSNPWLFGENVDLGIEVRITKPSEAGADRMVNAVGAHAVYPGDLILVVRVRPTTFDVVSRGRRFSKGRGIAPGHQPVHAGPAQRPPPSCRSVAIQRPVPAAVIRDRHRGSHAGPVSSGAISL